MTEQRNEWEAMSAKYQEVLEWEAQFAKEIEDARREEFRQAILDWEKQFAEEIAQLNEVATVTMYHGTRNTDIEFVEMEVKNYNSIGTWTTESVEMAQMYGGKVVEVNAVVSNPIIVADEDFDQFFGGYYRNEKKGMLCSKTVKKIKDDLIAQGYDAIMFKDSKIDLGTNEGTHTVIVLLNPVEQIVSHKYVA